jgi:histidine triad (HIT) family protein
LSKGYTLVVPKKEVDYLFDLDEITYTGLFLFIRKVLEALKESTGCKRVGIMVYGLDVPHAHVHLVPLKGTGNEMNFANPKLKLTTDEFRQIAKDINDRIG